MGNKQTSSTVSAIAAAMLNLTRSELTAIANEDDGAKTIDGFLKEIKTLAGSALSQDETPAGSTSDPETFKDRLERERADLAGRYAKLQKFLDVGTPGVEDEIQKDLLNAQAAAMGTYLTILDARLKLLR